MIVVNHEERLTRDKTRVAVLLPLTCVHVRSWLQTDTIIYAVWHVCVVQYICNRVATLLGVSSVVANQINEDEKSIKNFTFFYENEDDKVKPSASCTQTQL
jgi:hypothetical protein